MELGRSGVEEGEVTGEVKMELMLWSKKKTKNKMKKKRVNEDHVQLTGHLSEEEKGGLG